MPIIKRADVDPVVSSNYPAPHDRDLGRFEARPLGDAGGHYVLSGEITLVDDHGAHLVGAGEAAAFKAGDASGHHPQNRSDAPASYLIVGTRADEGRCHYSDVDMPLTKTKAGKRFTRRDGSLLQPGG